MKHFTLTILFFSLAFYAFPRGADPESPDSSSFFNMSLEQLMNVEVSVASLKSLTPRESPGIITVITADEIRNSGAHDLMEVLRQVPGIHFGVDVEGVVGIGIRGNWGHEGKVSLLIDGQEMNEGLYSTLQFGEHYPVDQVQKIEIIRGPGSSIYGGNAEYAVINIITKVNKDFQGVAATATYGQMDKTFASRSISVNGGKKFGDLMLNLGAYAGQANRSDHIYTDYLGNSFDMTSNSLLQNYSLNFNTEYKNLSFRFLGEFYGVQTRDYYDVALDTALTEKFPSYFFDLKYKWELSDKVSLTPRVQFKQQTPWSYMDSTVMPSEMWKVVYQKPSAGLTMNYDINKSMNLMTGVEYFIDEATQKIDTVYFSDGSKQMTFRNTDIFAQWLWSNKIANITIGSRYHYNESYGGSFVPRIGITKVSEKWHAKLLYSYAYRTPGIENINEGTEDIKPEQTKVIELEAGIQVHPSGYLTANVFDITTYKPIIYTYNEGDSYTNSGETGTRGFELNYKVKGHAGYADFNYSYYTIEGKTISKSYSACDDKVLLAFPAHTVNGSVHLNLSKMFVLGVTGSWYSSRFEYSGLSDEGKRMFEECKPQLLAGINLTMLHIGVKGMSASVGCFNILNEKEEFIQPYSSDHEPLPGKSREVRFKLSYNLDKSSK